MSGTGFDGSRILIGVFVSSFGVVVLGGVTTLRGTHWPLSLRISPFAQGTTTFTHRGGLPTVPGGHFGLSIGLQLGGLPVVPGGHSIGRQFGGVPICPSGHFGFSMGLQFGGVPVVPDGHGFVMHLGGFPVMPGGHAVGRQSGHLPV